MSLVAASLKNNLACEKKNNCKLFLTAERRKNKIKVVFSAQVSIHPFHPSHPSINPSIHPFLHLVSQCLIAF